MHNLNPQVDLYIADGCGRCDYYATDKCKVRTWQLVLENVRQIMLETPLKEEIKWGVPVYTYGDKNVVIIGALKDCVTLGFLKGVLLKDPAQILKKQGPSVQSARIVRFTGVEQVLAHAAILKEYIQVAIAIEESGVKVNLIKNLEPIPEELEQTFEELPAFKDAFYALPPGKQRGYIIFFSQPKQSATRLGRIEKYLEKIMNGEGMHDEYQKKVKKL